MPDRGLGPGIYIKLNETLNCRIQTIQFCFVLFFKKATNLNREFPEEVQVTRKYFKNVEKDKVS